MIPRWLGRAAAAAAAMLTSCATERAEPPRDLGAETAGSSPARRLDPHIETSLRLLCAGSYEVVQAPNPMAVAPPFLLHAYRHLVSRLTPELGEAILTRLLRGEITEPAGVVYAAVLLELAGIQSDWDLVLARCGLERGDEVTVAVGDVSGPEQLGAFFPLDDPATDPGTDTFEVDLRELGESWCEDVVSLSGEAVGQPEETLEILRALTDFEAVYTRLLRADNLVFEAALFRMTPEHCEAGLRAIAENPGLRLRLWPSVTDLAKYSDRAEIRSLATTALITMVPWQMGRLWEVLTTIAAADLPEGLWWEAVVSVHSLIQLAGRVGILSAGATAAADATAAPHPWVFEPAHVERGSSISPPWAEVGVETPDGYVLGRLPPTLLDMLLALFVAGGDGQQAAAAGDALVFGGEAALAAVASELLATTEPRQGRRFLDWLDNLAWSRPSLRRQVEALLVAKAKSLPATMRPFVEEHLERVRQL